MKWFIYAVLIVVSLTGGAAGMHYFDRYTFEEWTDIPFDTFTQSRDNCLMQSQRECGMFGGFAPRDQIEKTY